MNIKMKNRGPKILLFDIETAPMLAYVWGLWDQNVGLNQIKEDWHILSFSAKWLGDHPSKVIYFDQRKEKDITKDKKLLQKIWDLLDEADITITQNGKQFDHKKLNARFLINGFKPHSNVRMLDTLEMAKKHFAFTSNKLEYLSTLNKKYKKYTKGRKFSGFDLWLQCMKGNNKAWNEMKKYNIYDVLALEEFYNLIAPWGDKINYNAYSEDGSNVCQCGSTKFIRNGHNFTSSGKFQKWECVKCRTNYQSKQNLISASDRKNMLKKIP